MDYGRVHCSRPVGVDGGAVEHHGRGTAGADLEPTPAKCEASVRAGVPRRAAGLLTLAVQAGASIVSR
jgi:hypothetical protein